MLEKKKLSARSALSKLSTRCDEMKFADFGHLLVFAERKPLALKLLRTFSWGYFSLERLEPLFLI